MKAVVKSIQVGGFHNCHSLEEACRYYTNCGDLEREKIIFVIELPDGTLKQITIRDEVNETVAYGDFEGLPSMLQYAEEIL